MAKSTIAKKTELTNNNANRFKTFEEAKNWRKMMEVKLWEIQD